MQTTTTSKQFSLGKADILKGLLMAMIGAVLGFFQGIIEAGGDIVFDWDKIWKLALGAAVTYLVKNFFDKPKVVVTDVPEATMEKVKEGEATVKIH